MIIFLFHRSFSSSLLVERVKCSISERKSPYCRPLFPKICNVAEECWSRGEEVLFGRSSQLIFYGHEVIQATDRRSWGVLYDVPVMCQNITTVRSPPYAQDNSHLPPPHMPTKFTPR